MPSKSVKLSSRPAFARHIPTSSDSSESQRACVSTYLLDPSSDTRSGSLCILEYSEESGGLHVENEISTSAGVFRFDFQNPSTVVAALTDGSLVVQQILDPISSETTPVSSDMLLDLGLSDSSILVTTDNKGHAYLVDMNTSLIVSSWLAHSLPYVPGEGCEVWSCAVTKDAQTVVTGGEDGSMKLWDARSRTQIAQSKMFGAGVVFVDFPTNSSEEILTGSYDENIRVFDRRNLKNVLKEKKASLSGGVWNIEQNASTYCISCMYGGYTILNSESLDVVHQNRDVGTNLLYGATRMTDNSVLFCTFNDYLVVLDEF
ncbi:hypothetical protein CRE_24393 [Caenorhabditis remanei]|uniref:methylated diphthine methylhydrolase n=1 Tax=Caenorhabditis remanei TaxID=31234 RepID=E3MFR1_CAERE|nr:hypothetical protein CRE_24393 [Caenorhabditis remanei]